MPKLKKGSGIPLYIQLKEQLKSYIQANFVAGDMIPVESELETMFQVSRITVRKAIDELVDEQIVVKRQGRGTFVLAPKITQSTNRLYTWTEEMESQGRRPETKQLEVLEISPSRKLMQQLQLSPKEKVVAIKRVRLANGEPIAIMINYLRSSIVPGFCEQGLQSESLYQDLDKRYGVRFHEADELVSARQATDLEALTLGMEPDSAVLHILRTSYMEDGSPGEIVHLIAHPDRYQYAIHLTSSGRSRVL